MNRTQHHEKAEQLLADARKEPDDIRRGQILAEAQVHATLALSAAPGTIPPDLGVSQQRETSNTASTTEGRTDSAWGRAAVAGMGPGFPVPPLPEVPPDYLAEEVQLLRQSTRPAEPGSPAPPTTITLPPDRQPARPRRRPWAEQPGEQEPSDSDQEEPDDPGEQKPRGPEEPGPRRRLDAHRHDVTVM